MTIHQRKPYAKAETSLVIGIDIGTTYSGVSYALLQPGEVPRINPVVRFPGQTREQGYSKVPSVVCYDHSGQVIAIGPKTDPELNPILSETQGIRREEWFKLRLRPPRLAVDKRVQLEKLWSPAEPANETDGYANARSKVAATEPQYRNQKRKSRPVTDDDKTVVQIFTDFLKYLFKSAKEYIIETERNADPTFTWASIERNIFFVLTHPNGWEGKQQSRMRDAAVAAGLVDRSAAADRVTFVTEGEASLHFCLEKIPKLHKDKGVGILVADCGGGTVDLSAYSQTENGGYKEIVSPDCCLQGSVFVTSRARDYFQGKFKDSQFGSHECIDAMAGSFDKLEGAKCLFDDPNTPYFVKFGGFRDNDSKYGITGGKFKVPGAQMAEFFEPAVQDIIGGIKNQCRNAGVTIKFVLLVGGFAHSPYLYKNLCDYFESSNITVLRPDINQLNKAVADGAVSYYVDRYVSARIAKYSYGVEISVPFKPSDPEHVRRERTKYTDPKGELLIPGVFSKILEKGRIVTEETKFRNPYCRLYTPSQFSQWSTDSESIIFYSGHATNPPRWLDLEADCFHQGCTIKADMSNVRRNILPKYKGTQAYYQFDFEVVMLFGLTELKSYITWKEKGQEKRSDVAIVYD